MGFTCFIPCATSIVVFLVSSSHGVFVLEVSDRVRFFLMGRLGISLIETYFILKIN